MTLALSGGLEENTVHLRCDRRHYHCFYSVKRWYFSHENSRGTSKFFQSLPKSITEIPAYCVEYISFGNDRPNTSGGKVNKQTNKNQTKKKKTMIFCFQMYFASLFCSHSANSPVTGLFVPWIRGQGPGHKFSHESEQRGKQK